MLKYQERLARVWREYLRALFHPKMNRILHWVVMILLIPFHLVFVILGAGFEIILFLITVIRVPADFIQQSIDENEQAATSALFVVYCVSYPAKILFDFITGVQLISLGWLFLFINLVGWVGSLGGIAFQPFLMHDEKQTEPGPEENNQ